MKRLIPSLLLVVAACGHDVTLGGPNTLVRVDSEPPGINCEQGGIAIHTGLDTDGDTYLDTEEITSTQFVCNGVSPVQCAGGVIVSGTVVVRDTADFAQLASANCVDGDVLIAGVPDEALPLDSLEIVTGDLVIAGNANLTSLTGIANLREVGRRVAIQGNDSLSDLGSLGTLDRAEAIQITGNDALVDLRGLDALHEVKFGLNINNNGSLASLDGLGNVVTMTDTLSIRTNRSLTDLSALGQLRTGLLIEISGNVGLDRIELPSLEKVDVRLLLDTNSSITAIDLPALATVGDFVSIDTDPALQTVSAPSLLTVGSLLVRNNPSLTTVSAPSLLFATAHIELVNAPLLTSVGYGALVSIGANLTIRQTGRLTNLRGLAAVETIGGTMTIRDNQALPSFDGLGNLQNVAGSMIVSGNPNLTGFNGLDAFTEVGADLTITNNSSLPKATAQGFANRITVHGTTTIN